MYIYISVYIIPFKLLTENRLTKTRQIQSVLRQILWCLFQSNSTKKFSSVGKKKLPKKNIVIVNITPITLIIKRYAQGTFGGTGGTASSKSNPGGAKTPTAGGVKFPHTSFKPGIQS